MKYDPRIHHRRSIRLKGYDYTQAGAYFITICTNDMKCIFGTVENEEMILNEFGEIAYNEWSKLPQRFTNSELDVFQVMPNHLHGIIILNTIRSTVGATLAVAPIDERATVKVAPTGEGTVKVAPTDEENMKVAPTVGDIVGAYKSIVSNEMLKIFKERNKTMGKLWQRNYYEHIIRNELAYQNISNYIISNPAKWDGDKFYGK
jgi:putative transposase